MVVGTKQHRPNEIAVRIHELRPWFKVQSTLFGQQCHDILVGNPICRKAPTGLPQQMPLISNATRVVYQVTELDSTSKVMEFGHVFSNDIVQRKLALCREKHDGRHGELL